MHINKQQELNSTFYACSEKGVSNVLGPCVMSLFHKSIKKFPSIKLEEVAFGFGLALEIGVLKTRFTTVRGHVLKNRKNHTFFSHLGCTSSMRMKQYDGDYYVRYLDANCI